MNVADDARAVTRFRRPWFWLVVLLIAVVLSTLLCIQNARVRVAQNQRQFTVAQQLRFSVLKRAIDDLFADAVQVASTSAEIYGRVPPQTAMVSRIARDMYASSLNRHIFGTGVFFVRGGFDRPDMYVSVYVRRRTSALPRSRDDHPFQNGVEVDYVSRTAPTVGNYTRAAWFRVAMQSFGRTIGYGPYVEEGTNFVSVLRAFARDGRRAGVASVDILTPEFITIMRRNLEPGDVAAVIGPAPHHHRMLETGPLRGGAADRVSISGALRYTPHSRVELSSDARALHAANRSVWIGTTLIVLGIWAVAVVIAVGVVQRWSATERELELYAQQTLLERQIEIARSVEGELRKTAYTDSLTGLPNRAAFLQRAREELDAPQRSSAVFFIDLDRFNRVNETLGHLSGDDLLRTVGARISSLLAANDMVARLGGDEFVILKDGCDGDAAAGFANRLLSCLAEPIVIQGRTIYPEASVGIVAVDASYGSADEMLRDADIAMYEAKHRGRAQYVVFDAEMRRRVAHDAELELALRRAIERGELVPYYQPVVGLRTGRIEGFEALVRWHRAGQTVLARDFMPFAETHGLAAAIDVHVMTEVFRQSRAIYDCFPGSKIAVNISASELEAPGLAQTIERLRERESRAGDRFELEITETTMMTNSDGAKRTIDALLQLGCQFVLDDFGTGYSSLAYLQRLPICGIKIDRAFVAPLPDDLKAVEIIRSIVLLARSMGLAVTAEGVETMEQYDLLRELDVDYAQGFFFSPAVDIKSLMLLQSRSISSRSAVE